MNSRSERTASSPTMEELKARQQTALQANMSKATNLQKSVMLTESNWTGLTNAVELTGETVLKLQETAEQLITAQQMDEKLNTLVENLLLEHAEAVEELQENVQKLMEANASSWNWMQETMKNTVRSGKTQQEELLKEFQLQVGKASESFSSHLSKAQKTLDEHVSSMMWKMYLPTVILVLWELVRHLFLRG